MDDLLTLLDKIKDATASQEVYVKSKLTLEIEKMYTYNALGICLGKLEKIDEQKYRAGLQRTRAFLQKSQDIHF